MQNERTVKLTDLCWDDIIFPRILNLLTFHDLFNMRCCSQLYKELIDQYFAKYVLYLDSKYFTKQQFLTLLEYCQNIRRIKLDNVDYVSNDILAQFFENNKNIEFLTIIGCNNISDQALKPVIYHFKKLTKICLIDCNWISEGFLDCFMQHHKTIEHFHLGGSGNISYNCIKRLMVQYKCKNMAENCNGIYIHNLGIDQNIFHST